MLLKRYSLALITFYIKYEELFNQNSILDLEVLLDWIQKDLKCVLGVNTLFKTRFFETFGEFSGTLTTMLEQYINHQYQCTSLPDVQYPVHL